MYQGIMYHAIMPHAKRREVKTPTNSLLSLHRMRFVFEFVRMKRPNSPKVARAQHRSFPTVRLPEPI